MASRADLELAKKLLAAHVVGEDQLRSALAAQAEVLARGKVVDLGRVLVAQGVLGKEALGVLAAGDPLETQPFPKYRLERALGEGGSSVVYGGTYLPNGAKVAVKVFSAVQSLRKDLLARFYEEARLLIELDHENVVAGYEVGSAGGLHFFSMDWVQGPTVLQMIERGGVLPSPTALWITIQMAKALTYLHEHGLLHRDIKPGNVMIDATGRARLIDLGLVRRLDASAPRSDAEESVTVGTVEYISPEQARGRGDIDVRTDVYSLGVTLYHMVVGDVPFHGETDYEVMAKHILTGLDSQKVKTRRIAPEVTYAITKMMSKEREFRYADCPQVVADLSRFLPPGGPPPLVLPVDPTPPPSSPGPRSPVVGPPPGPKPPPVVRPRSGEVRRRSHW
ncbi:MAG: serine/threonine protein kinase [Planctomycetes bacterium]|nr:serine/threonine protein kinase [Planctomycetota bacterium]